MGAKTPQPPPKLEPGDRPMSPPPPPPRTCPASPLTHRAAHALAVAVFEAIERREIGTRTAISDALESYADGYFGVLDGTGIARLRESIRNGPRTT